MSFLGSTQYGVDAKGRICMPSDYRDELGADFIIRICQTPVANVQCMSLETFETEKEKYFAKYLQFDDAEFYEAMFYSQTFRAKFDTQGRIALSADVRKRAQIGDEVYVTGAGRTVRIMSVENYERMSSAHEESQARINSAYSAHYSNNTAALASTASFQMNGRQVTRVADDGTQISPASAAQQEGTT